jgi:hypothetical protein
MNQDITSSAYELSNIDLKSIIDTQINTIINILKKYSGPKIIIIDESLIKQFDLLVPFKFFKEYNVIYFYKQGYIEYHDLKNYIYILRPTFDNVKFIEKHKDFIKDKSKNNTHNLYFVQTRRLMIENLLNRSMFDKSDIWMYLNINDCDISMFPIDYNWSGSAIISIEFNNVIESIADGDIYPVFITYNNLLKLGPISSVKVYGPQSKKIKSLLNKNNTWCSSSASAVNSVNNNNKLYGNDLIIIDRTMDLITPCLTFIFLTKIKVEFILIE